ncbi:MAG: hypothetical protein A2077_00605 [Nitrospirae bacterium GWC2_46_6]|nr:MAG: hypothetical protein A2077_00605 [Nitrospirae bacterium GWC2_46_6]OGW21824.1 MAG: hypothetical protein A2Z82_09420 [Nitrospirae bacterium GWA2_46_11]OGW24104.1 MAG: hypothetical protein A2X55_10365 [Nitrospirae bacterium GWB2_47_37]HAK88729.1 hypothetical protein [Nitrospiraceae bacterium]HCZ11414.1 hypothetical protein [Nitrospiraceae bacterium]
MYLPEDILLELKRKSNKEKTTIAHIIRNAVSDFLKREKEKDWEKDPLWNMVGAGSSQGGNISEEHDKYLYGKDK